MAVSAQSVAQEYQIEVDELVDMAEYMEVDSAAEPFLLRIIAESMVQPLPAEWRECDDESSGQVYYFNEETNETTWEHPLDQYYKNLLFIERKNNKLQAQEQGAAAAAAPEEEYYDDGQAYDDGQSSPGSYYEEPQQASRAPAAAAAPPRKKKRAPTEEELQFEKRLVAADKRAEAFQRELEAPSRPTVQLHKALLERIAAAQGGAGKGKGADKGEGSKYAAGSGDDSSTLSADHNIKRRVGAQTKRARGQAGELRQQLRGVRGEVETLRRDLGAEVQRALAAVAAAPTAGVPKLVGGHSPPPARPMTPAAAADAERVQQMELELSTLRGEIASMEHAVSGAATPTAGGLLSPGPQDAEVRQLRAEIATLKANAAAGGASPGGASPGGASGAMREQVETLTRSVQELEELLKTERAALATLKVTHATDVASRDALSAEKTELTAKLEQMQSMVAQKDDEGAGASELIATIQQELASVKEQRDAAAQQVTKLQAEATEASAASADAAATAAEKLRSAEELATTRLAELEGVRASQGESGARIATLEGELAAAVAGKAEAVKAQQEQAESMGEREAKAVRRQRPPLRSLPTQLLANSWIPSFVFPQAKECERMFTLVKQAHEKVAAKDKEYTAKMEEQKKRYDADFEKKVADRIKLVQKKLDEESAKRRALFNQIQELKGNIRVYCRVRPCLSAEEKELGMGIEFAGQHNDLVVANPERPQLAPKRFEFEHVFTPKHVQADLFKEIEPLATSVVDGYNVCIFACAPPAPLPHTTSPLRADHRCTQTARRAAARPTRWRARRTRRRRTWASTTAPSRRCSRSSRSAASCSRSPSPSTSSRSTTRRSTTCSSRRRSRSRSRSGATRRRGSSSRT